MAARKTRRTKVFISYSHQDADWLHRLRVHLKPLERDYEIDIWDDRKINPGSKWRQEIEKAVNEAKVAILLISADFLASDFIITNELPSLLEAAEKEGAIILPVIVSPSRFLRSQSLAQFQSVNAPNNPLLKMNKVEQEEVFVQITEYIETAFESLKQPQSPEGSESEILINERANYDLLNGVSLFVYFKSLERSRANEIYAFFLSKGMRPQGFGEGKIGYSGAKTIVHSPELREVAKWLKENVNILSDFKIKRLHPDDTYNGIALNLW
jgi:TIR domain-containing protein